MASKVVPLRSTVILQLEQSTRLPSGLHIPETSVDPNRKAIVVSVGPDAAKDGIKPGHSCVFLAHSIPPSKLDLGEDGIFYVTASNEIAAVLETDPESLI